MSWSFKPRTQTYESTYQLIGVCHRSLSVLFSDCQWHGTVVRTSPNSHSMQSSRLRSFDANQPSTCLVSLLSAGCLPCLYSPALVSPRANRSVLPFDFLAVWFIGWAPQFQPPSSPSHLFAFKSRLSSTLFLVCTSWACPSSYWHSHCQSCANQRPLPQSATLFRCSLESLPKSVSHNWQFQASFCVTYFLCHWVCSDISFGNQAECLGLQSWHELGTLVQSTLYYFSQLPTKKRVNRNKGKKFTTADTRRRLLVSLWNWYLALSLWFWEITFIKWTSSLFFNFSFERGENEGPSFFGDWPLTPPLDGDLACFCITEYLQSVDKFEFKSWT